MTRTGDALLRLYARQGFRPPLREDSCFLFALAAGVLMGAWSAAAGHPVGLVTGPALLPILSGPFVRAARALLAGWREGDAPRVSR